MLLELGRALARRGRDAARRRRWAVRSTARSVDALWELTRGNALFLRELVRHGVDRGAAGRGRRRVALARRGHGRARGWRSSSTCASRTPARARARVLELVAVGAPLELGLLEPARAGRAGGARARRARAAARRRAAAVRRRRASAARRGGARAADAHARSRRSTRGSRTRSRRAARGAAATCCGSPSGDWRPARRRRRAVRACGRAGAGGARRGAGRAPRPRGGAGGRRASARGWRSARALAGRGRAPEAQRVLAGAGGAGRRRRRARGGRDRRARATCSGGWTAPTRRTPCCATPSGAWPTTRCATSSRRSACGSRPRQGRPQAALAAARPLLRDAASTSARGRPSRWARSRRCSRAGRTDEAVALAEASLPAAAPARDELPHAEPVLLGMRAMALRLAGRLRGGDDAVGERLRALARPPVGAGHRGRGQLARA